MLNRIEKLFKKYNSEFLDKILENLMFNMESINTTAVFLIMVNLNSMVVKRIKTNKKIIEFTLAGLKVLKREKDSSADRQEIQYKHLL